MNVVDKSIRPSPPVPTPRKELKINVDYEEKAKRMLRDALDEKSLTIADLTLRLERMGASMSKGGVANKISRGGFSAAFLLLCLDAIRKDEPDTHG